MMSNKLLKIMIIIISIIILLIITTLLFIGNIKKDKEEIYTPDTTPLQDKEGESGLRQKYESNEIYALEIDNRTMCLNYFQDLKSNLLYNVSEAYNYMSQEYREKRFGSEEELLQYVNANIVELSQINLEEYQVNHYEDYTEYVCKDQYENLYIFKETSVMQYTVTLDTYTLEEKKFNDTYNKVDDEEKVQMNADKIIQMMNRRDYKTMYKLINQSFKNNNFKTEEDFTKYMKETYPLHYKAEFTNTTSEGNIYLQEMTLTDITEKDNQSKQMNLIMKLNEGIDFEISFEIK